MNRQAARPSPPAAQTDKGAETPVRRAPVFFWGALLAAVLASRLCHSGVLWEPGELPLAAAIQILHGKALYSGIWYDKPPLNPLVCLLWGAQAGWVLRLAGALYTALACVAVHRFARELWSEREGRLAAGLLGFFLIFGLPAAVIPLGPDLLLLAPHTIAVYLAWKNRPFLSGLAAGLAFQFNSKAVFVLAACALWQYRRLPRLAAGFVVPSAVAVAWLGASGALGAYWEQVWRTGFLYAGATFIEHPLREGFVRTLNWLGFHAALTAGALWYWRSDRGPESRRVLLWAALSLAAVAGGWRFFPRYYLQLLPALTLAAARGTALLGAGRILVLIALIVPLARFGPRYVLLAQDLLAGTEHAWADTAMDRDSRAVARLVLDRASPGDTLFVWGYRPDLYVYTRLPAATRFLDSQPLTGVFADRHLSRSDAAAPELARGNRAELARSRPTFVVDGLSRYNPELSMESFKDLGPWLARYQLVAQTAATAVYRLRP
jgi:hypothetical protein